ncbi:Mg-dependent DNase [Multifurca ochricompacta]|uniref:Mg-dependent DNase n=1 Tax=Multifurca ochricompacta TaxID=376703 RepID=A0AAD4MCM4_9AGAM|nr:Mg-dependent DNase [Multifurca ochricompacta]
MTSSVKAAASGLRFIVNLIDPVFRGQYHGHQKHDDDLNHMLERSKRAGVVSMIITGGSLRESKQALALAKRHNFYATVGCHPTRSTEFEKDPSGYLQALDDLVGANLSGPGRVVAIGECGLDYDRTHFASRAIQQKHLHSQLALAKKYHLPLFLHSRAAHNDLIRILREEGLGDDGGRAVGARGGVVHSFTGSFEDADDYIKMGFYISINGCSLKTEDNLTALKSIDLRRIMFETDAPWCSMTSTHASRKHIDSLPTDLRSLFLPPAMRKEAFVPGRPVKGRNEPSAIGAVAWVAHKVKEEISFDELVDQGWRNTIKLFGLKELVGEQSGVSALATS